MADAVIEPSIGCRKFLASIRTWNKTNSVQVLSWLLHDSLWVEFVHKGIHGDGKLSQGVLVTIILKPYHSAINI